MHRLLLPGRVVDRSRLTLNLGVRYDKYDGILPEQSNPGGTFIAAAQRSRDQKSINQTIAVWRAGASYDLTGNGRTALKAQLQPLRPAGRHRPRHARQPAVERRSQDCPWTDPNGDGKFQASEITGACPGVQRRHLDLLSDADGRRLAVLGRSDRRRRDQLMRDMRVGAMFYYRTNRDQLGVRNIAVPTSAYTPVHHAERSRAAGEPGADDGDGLQPQPGVQRRCRTTSATTMPYLDTEYKGVEFTATKRFSKKWQMVAGFTHRQEHRRAQSAPNPVRRRTLASLGGDLNDPNNTLLPERHHRQRLGGRLPPVGQLSAAVGDQPRRLADLEQRLPVRVDLLADARAAAAPARQPDARQPDGVAQRARRRAVSDA